jgi:hypothetical protein
MRRQVEWGKQATAHATQSLADALEMLIEIAEADLVEHANHYEKWKDDEDGCRTCYLLNKLGQNL